MKKLNVRVQEITNIKGGKLKYLVVNDGEEDVIISVGEKTYNGVKQMIEKGETVTVTEEDLKKGEDAEIVTKIPKIK